MKSFIEAYLLFINKMIEENQSKDYMIFILAVGICIFLFYILQLIIHETGHLVFGLFVGYRLISFRIFYFAIIKENHKFIIKRFGCQGSAGQCLMIPPAKEGIPYILHTMGGILFNFFSAATAIPIAFSNIKISFPIRIALLIFAFYGFGFSIINGLPLKKTEVVNDGLTLYHLWKDPLARQCYYIQLTLLPKLIAGISYGEFSFELIKLPKNSDLSNSIIGYHKILEYYFHADRKEWGKAAACLQEFRPYLKAVVPMIRNIIISEEIFLTIVIRNSMQIEALLNIKNLTQNLNMKHIMDKKAEDFHLFRIQLAYKVLLSSEEFNKEKYKRDLIKLKKNYLYQGEALFCMNIINELLFNPG